MFSRAMYIAIRPAKISELIPAVLTMPIPAGFIHLPLEQDYPIASSVDAIAAAIRLMMNR